MTFDPSRRSFLSSMVALTAADVFPAGPPARYVELGRTGLKITRFVFGSMVTSDPAVVERAFDMGVNCFTTARDYQDGNNERLLGAALKGRRDRVILSTEAIDMMWRPKSEKETTAYVLGNLETSLRELQTDYVDLFFLHHKDEPGWIPDEAAEAVRIAKRQGKIRYGGITTHALPKMADYLVKSELFEAVIPIFNFTMDANAHAAARKVHEAGIGVIAMKVMAGGRGSTTSPAPLKRPGALAAALRWAMHHPSVDAAVSSVKDVDQLEENVRAMSEPFSDADRQLLAATLRELGPHHCRLCGRCEGTCAQGLPIPEILRCGMYAEGYGEFALGRGRFLQVPPAARGGRCRECPTCTVRCVHGLDVAAKVRHVHELLG